MSQPAPQTPTALAAQLRAELQRRMPGYRWTVHRPDADGRRIDATGTQSAGSNRLSTLTVIRRLKPFGGGDYPCYEAAIYGPGTRGVAEFVCVATTLARSLRFVQDRAEAQARHWCGIAARLAEGRIAPAGAPPPAEDAP